MAGGGQNIGCTFGGCYFAAVIIIFCVALTVGFLGGPGETTVDASTSGGATTGDTTTAKISAKQLKWIKSTKPGYIEAANKYDLPWQIVAALHCREGGCNPGKSALSGEPIGSANPDHPEIITKDLQDSLNKAARHIHGSAKDVYGVKLGKNNTKEELIKAFVSYNRGYMYVKGGCDTKLSPYALNNFDKAHYHMKWPTGYKTQKDNSKYYCEPGSTRGNVNVPNGAYTTYVYLINKGI